MGDYSWNVEGREPGDLLRAGLRVRLVLSNLKRYIFVKFERSPFEVFEFGSFLSSLSFSHNFPGTGRKAVLFGPVPYRYGHVFHPPCSFPPDSPIYDMFVS